MSIILTSINSGGSENAFLMRRKDINQSALHCDDYRHQLCLLCFPNAPLHPYEKFTLRSRFCPAHARDTLDTYSTRFSDCMTCFISASGMIWRLALTNACEISSISANLGLGIGGLITGVLMRPRSQTAVLYRTCRRPMSSNMLHYP